MGSPVVASLAMWRCSGSIDRGSIRRATWRCRVWPSCVLKLWRVGTQPAGLVVENLAIHGRDEADAERKLRQMYQHCEIIECIVSQGNRKQGLVSVEDVVSLISK